MRSHSINIVIGFVAAVLALIALSFVDILSTILLPIPLQLQYTTDITLTAVARSMLLVAAIEECIRYLMITKSIHVFGIDDTIRHRIMNGFLFASGFMLFESILAILNTAITTSLIFLIFPFVIHIILSILFFVTLPLWTRLVPRVFLLSIAISLHMGANILIYIMMH